MDPTKFHYRMELIKPGHMKCRQCLSLLPISTANPLELLETARRHVKSSCSYRAPSFLITIGDAVVMEYGEYEKKVVENSAMRTSLDEAREELATTKKKLEEMMEEAGRWRERMSKMCADATEERKLRWLETRKVGDLRKENERLKAELDGLNNSYTRLLARSEVEEGDSFEEACDEGIRGEEEDVVVVEEGELVEAEAMEE